MELFITIGFIDYEGGTVQGVYSTRELADAAEARIRPWYDNTAVFKIMVDNDEEISV